jgi:hypothetical protein
MFDLVSLKNKPLMIILYLLLSNNENSDMVFYDVSFEIRLTERHRKKEGEKKQIRNKEKHKEKEKLFKKNELMPLFMSG